jgi:hypothetical protein
MDDLLKGGNVHYGLYLEYEKIMELIIDCLDSDERKVLLRRFYNKTIEREQNIKLYFRLKNYCESL